MNNQKFFLIIAIFLSIFLLNEQWDRQHAVDANGNLLYQAKTENTKSATKSANAMYQVQFAQKQLLTSHLAKNQIVANLLRLVQTY